MVCRYLCKKGQQNLQEIVRALQGPPVEQRPAHGALGKPAVTPPNSLTLGQIKQALLVLLQHNWVNAYLLKDEDGTKNPRPPQTLYEADVPRILQGIRCEPMRHAPSMFHGAGQWTRRRGEARPHLPPQPCTGTAPSPTRAGTRAGAPHTLIPPYPPGPPHHHPHWHHSPPPAPHPRQHS